jgi:curved DNA-binding protein CbpA
MSDEIIDYYELLQVSPSAELETIHRVYRMLAQRYHPDNQESGNPTRFREVSEAYRILSDPEERARYDVQHQKHRQERWKLVSTGGDAENDFDLEEMVRLTVLEVLYTKRRMEPREPAIFSRVHDLVSGPEEVRHARRQFEIGDHG